MPCSGVLLRALTGAALILAGGATASAQEACPAKGNAVVLTVAGAVSKPNRGAIDEATDRFLVFSERRFEKARSFTTDELAALGMATIRTPSAYDKQVHALTGPTLASVLDAAGAGGGTVKVQAVDRYEAELTREEMAKLNPILALCRNGKPLGLGDLGPVFLAYPTPETPTDDDFAKMIWSAVFIEVR